VLDVDFGMLVSNPRPHAERINQFLGRVLDVDRMLGAVDPGLYRNRAK
jgi:hypothetical protein